MHLALGFQDSCILHAHCRCDRLARPSVSVYAGCGVRAVAPDWGRLVRLVSCGEAPGKMKFRDRIKIRILY